MELSSDGTTLDQSATDGARPAGDRGGLAALPVLTVLGHPDLARIGDQVFLGELARGREALLSRREPRFSAPRSVSGEPLGVPFLSRRPIRLGPLADGGVRLRIDGSSTRVVADGVTIYDGRDFSAAALDDGVVIELSEHVVLLLQRRSPPALERMALAGLLGESAEIEAVRYQISRAATLSVPVLLRGETGTGKELAARALHEQSTRAQGPFLTVNLGALPPTLAAAELFGVRKGAYTGASQDLPGWFGRADGGTLFLDEIGEAPPEVQVMLLRTLETGEIVPVGSQTPRRVDVRVVSATDADLEEAIGRGAFRAPLLHRLAGYLIRLPPLRSRREDIGRLLIHFLAGELESLGQALPQGSSSAEHWLPAALAVRIARYTWPGNIRQLRNVARQLAVDGPGQTLLRLAPNMEDLLPETVQTLRRAAEAAPAARVPEETMRLRKPSEVSEDELVTALREHRWNLKATAGALGVARTSLYTLLEQSQRVRAATDVPPEEVRAAFEHCGGDIEATAATLEISERALRQRLKDLGLR